jgi:parallel beta-helix repeat protein
MKRLITICSVIVLLNIGLAAMAYGFTVTASAGPGGTIDPNGTTETDWSVEFRAIPDPGYLVSMWYIDYLDYSFTYNDGRTSCWVYGDASVRVTFGIPASIYVDADNITGPWDGSSQHPFAHVQDAVNAAVDGSRIIIAPGIYRESVSLAKTLILTGTDPDDPNIIQNTIIDGLGFETAVKVEGDSPLFYPTATIAGLTVLNSGLQVYGVYCRAGTANIINSHISSVYADYDADVIASKSVLDDVDVSYKAGRGFDANNCQIGSLLSWRHCNIRNSTLKSFTLYEASLDMNDCVITGPPRWPDSLAVFEAGDCFGEIDPNVSIRISNSKIANCPAGGIYLWNSDYSITNTVVRGNNGSGISLYYAHHGTIRNCVISDNTASVNEWATGHGGGLNIGGYSGPVRLLNCTIVNNEADHGAGIYWAEPYTWDGVKNCIVANNIAGEQITTSEYGDPNELHIEYSDVQGGWPGIGNIDVDPAFVDGNNPDPNARDYHLQSDSGCINAGDPNFIPEPNETDLDGKPRLLDGLVDMGAYEFEFLPLECTVKITPQTINRKSNQPQIQAVIELPDGITNVDVDGSEPPMLYCGDDLKNPLFPKRTDKDGGKMSAWFSKDELVDRVTANGDIKLTVAGKLNSGQSFCGTDTVKIIY